MNKKVCKGCRFFNENTNLCLFFCEDRIEQNSCLSQRIYVQQTKNDYNSLKNDLCKIFEKIENPNFNKSVFTYWNTDISRIVWKYGNNTENCKKKIYKYIADMDEEISSLSQI